MVPEFLALDGFVGYQRRTELDLSGRKTIGIIGPNESGKTTLLHAVSYALYGRTLAERDEQLLNDYCDKFVVELRANLPGGQLDITRGRDKSGALICEVGGFQSRKPSEASAYILEQLRLGYTDFIGLSYFQQGDIHQFMAGDKRAYFTRWTSSLAMWKRLEEGAAAREKQLAREADRLEAQREQYLETLEQAEETRAELTAAKAGLAKAQADAKLVDESVRTLQKQLSRSEAQETLKQALDSLRDQLHQIDEQIERAERTKQDLDRQKSQESKGVCPLLDIECQDLSEVSRRRLNKLHQQSAEQTELIAELGQKREEVISKGKKLKKRIVKSPIAKIKTDLAAAKKSLIESNREVQRETSRKAQAQARLDLVKRAEAKLKTIDDEIEKLKAKARRCSFVRYMCGKNGIPATVIEGELAKVEDRCNWIFERLDYPKQISFKGYRELGSFERMCPICGSTTWHRERCRECGTKRPRKRKEEPTVTIVEGAVERPFELESGGAKILASFAVRLSSGLFVSTLTGVPMEMIILDETFAMLDRSNRAKVMGLVIDKLNSEFGVKRQFVVSHEDDITHTIDDLIVVRKERGSSVARWA